MRIAEHTFSYLEYSGIDEMITEDRELVIAAKEAMAGSYAPYSGFNVGAAVRLANGVIVRGANQENAAFPSGLCAERTAMFAAGANYPDVPMTSIAVIGGPAGDVTDSPTPPCGPCRQVMSEFRKKAGKPISVILAGKNKIYKIADSNDLLPFIFNL